VTLRERRNAELFLADLMGQGVRPVSRRNAEQFFAELAGWEQRPSSAPIAAEVVEAEGTGPARIQARLLWPALGFPAVVTPNARPSKDTMREGDATTCVCVLVLSDHAALSSAHAAEHLRYVSWDKRGRRHIRNNPAASFPAAEISVVRRTPVAGRKDRFGQHIKFGHNGKNQHGITALLADHVTRFYARPG
jgi:hypothetical protein